MNIASGTDVAENHKEDEKIKPDKWKPWLGKERFCNPESWNFRILKKTSFSLDPMRTMISKYWNQPQMKENVQGDWEKNDHAATNGEQSKGPQMKENVLQSDGQKAIDDQKEIDQAATNGEQSKESQMTENVLQGDGQKAEDGWEKIELSATNGEKSKESQMTENVLQGDGQKAEDGCEKIELSATNGEKPKEPQMTENVLQGDGQKAEDEWLKINHADTNGEKSKELENRREETRKETPDGVTGMSCKKNESRGVLEDRKHQEVLSDNEIQDLQEKVPEGQIKILWIGHASLLIQMDGVNILTDPIFSNKAGPKNMVGYSRYREPAVTVAKLKDNGIKIDAVIISHNHYDHFDKQSIRDLHSAFPTIEWFVPMKLQSDLTSLGCEYERVHETTWWQSWSLKSDERITFHFTPAKHWSGRNPTDWYVSLWGSWIIKGKTATVFFAGDTGYEEEIFTAIAERFKPITVAALPIGAYEPRHMMECQHINPAEAVKIHKILGAKISIGIHWRTFQLSCEEIDDPIRDLEEARKDQEVDEDDFITLEKSLITTINCDKDSTQAEPSLHIPD